MRPSTTLLLIGTNLLAAGLAAWSFSRLRSAATDARDSGEDLQIVQIDTNDLRASNVKAASGAVPAIDLNRRVQLAASASDVTDRLLSVEPTSIVSEGSSLDAQAGVMLRFSAVSMKGLITFLNDVGKNTDGLDAKAIQLSPAANAPASSLEAWNVDVTLLPRNVPDASKLH